MRPSTYIAICGSRSITRYSLVLSVILDAFKSGIIPPSNNYIIVSGGAKGVDTLAREFAHKNNLEFEEIKPDYSTENGRHAPLIRNEKIAERADILVAIHDSKSTGTLHMISCMKRMDKPCYIHNI
jgi:hypothetical protein